MTLPNGPDRGINIRSEGTVTTPIETLAVGLVLSRARVPLQAPPVAGVILPRILRATDTNVAEAAVSATKRTKRPPPENSSIIASTVRGLQWTFTMMEVVIRV